MPEITGNTRVVALLGSPVAHSLSPLIHNASFAHAGLDAIYTTFDVSSAGAGAAIDGIRALGLAGANVTMPLKGAVIPHLDELTPEAELMGAVNTIVNDSGRLIGHNTDGAGALRAASEAGFDVVGKKVTIIGTGGAGSAIYTQAAFAGASSISIFKMRTDGFSETERRVQEVADRSGATLNLFRGADSEQLRAQIEQSSLIVNATAIGMDPRADEAVIPSEWIHAGQGVMDTVYHPVNTLLLQHATQRSATAINGLGMLLWQAALAENLWFGIDMDVEFIRSRLFAKS